MPNLQTKYLGLNLRNPLIVGSSGLTDSVEKIVELEKCGAGAVVLKSLFEEEITLEYEKLQKEANENGMSNEALDYLDFKIKQDNLNKYLTLIKEVKEKTFIPVIASIHCFSAHEWLYFAKKIESAGADALELNVFLSPADRTLKTTEKELLYVNLAKKIKAEIKIPVALKISFYSASLSQLIVDLSNVGIEGLVLFNRFFSPDFDIDNFKILHTSFLSSANDYIMPLRWISMLSGIVGTDFSATTGIHNGQTVLKMLLAGAKTVQIVSTLYKNGTFYLQTILDEMERWMEKHGFETIAEFRGKMAQQKTNNPEVYERMQFMKYFSGYQK